MSVLKQKAIQGVVWTSINRFTTIGIQFISGIILARLLTPDDYGCIGMLSIFMLISSTFIDGGFGSALIQKKRPSQEDYSTIFIWNLGISIIIYTLLYVSAPAIAYFYKIPLLSDILRIQGIILILNALQTVQVNQLNKQFRFKKIAIVSLITSITSLSVTIYLAYEGLGVWALVTQNILLSLIPTIIYWFTNKWYPQLRFSIHSFKELFNFGFYMFLSSIINTTVNNIQGLLIGRLYNPTIVGYYSKAHSTEKLASTSISQIIAQVSYPLYAELQDNKLALINVVKKLTALLAYITFPMLSLLALLATPIFTLLYSEKWLNCVPYFQILCIAGIAICLQSVNSQTISAIGKSKLMLKWTVVKQLSGVSIVVLGLIFFGIEGLLVGMVIKSWLIYIVNASLVSTHIGYKLKNQLLDLCPIMLLALTALCISYIGGSFFECGLYIDAIIKLIIYVVLYLFGSYVLKLKAFIETRQLISNFVLKKIKK